MVPVKKLFSTVPIRYRNLTGYYWDQWSPPIGAALFGATFGLVMGYSVFLLKGKKNKKLN